MAALDFPASPTVGQQYVAPNGVTYQWDGLAWVVAGTQPAVPTGPAGGDLTGTYPNPTVTPTAKSKWSDSGTTLQPVSAGRNVTVPGSTAAGDQSQLVLGSRTPKTHVVALAGLDFHAVASNAYWNGSAWVQDDPTKPSWFSYIDLTGDTFGVQRIPAGGANVSLFLVQGVAGPGSTPNAVVNGFLHGRAWAGGVYSATTSPWGSKVWAQVPMATAWVSNSGMTAAHIVKAPSWDAWCSISFYGQIDANPGGWFWQLEVSTDGGSTWVLQGYQYLPVGILFATLSRTMPLVANSQCRISSYNGDTVAHNITQALLTLAAIGQT